jgi:hypothetical protein
MHNTLPGSPNPPTSTVPYSSASPSPTARPHMRHLHLHHAPAHHSLEMFRRWLEKNCMSGDQIVATCDRSSQPTKKKNEVVTVDGALV